ncbi:hypothetical protein C482_18587 [Natrialba chahannaoensis JCM 10990]|uniref:Uncharacterized protein n=1 Tax=Natrialba chahannaoensis JCM 10990 TaxID=1227492 RepID=M0A710_9EURY|nr:hypothetical protein [Natrialba chahannaoensis]ELY94344.1 hypothetical protein C482_18587 [Natrialba chahannaoensis JCM 10990]
MERRTVLASIGIGLGVTAAGCLSETDATPTEGSEPNPDSEGGTSERATDPDEQPLSTKNNSPTAVDPDTTVDRQLGDETLESTGLRKPVHLVLANRRSEEQTPTLVIERDETTVLEEAFELGADAAVHVAVTDLGEYTARVVLPETETQPERAETVSIGYEQFDCNQTTATLAVTDEEITSHVASTLMACSGVVTATVDEGETSEATATAGLGSDETESGPGHTLVVHNPTDETRSTRVLIDTMAESAPAPLFDGVYTLESDATAAVDIPESDEYELTVTRLDSDAVDRTQIDTGEFDCNSSTTHVELDAAGALESATMSTLMGCAGVNAAEKPETE